MRSLRRAIVKRIVIEKTCGNCGKRVCYKWRVQRDQVLYVLTLPTCSTCPTCPTCVPAQIYFTDRKIEKWTFCTHTFLRVLSLILELNFAISAKMWIDILLKDDVCEKLNFDKIKFYW